MIRVKVSQRNAAGALVPKGHLEYHGLKIRRPDGTTWVERDSKGRPVPEEVKLHPPGLVPAQVAVQIGFELSAGKVQGKADSYEWAVVG